MSCIWVHDCDPGKVSDGARLGLYQTLSIECPSIFFWYMLCVIVSFFSSFFVLFLLSSSSRWSFVDVSLDFSCPTDHVLDWQPRILLGMVEARSVNVKNTTTTKLTHPAVTKVKRSVGYKYVLNRWHVKTSLGTCCNTKMYHSSPIIIS